MTHEQPNQPIQRFDPFEEELRQVLADEATEPAPERLVARVAEIPDGMRPGSALVGRVRGRLGSGLAAGPAFGFGLGLAAVAAVAIVLVGGSLLLGGLAPSSDVGGPSSGPVGGSPSTGAVSPSPSVGPSSLGPVGGPIPADFQPASATFTSADDGWLLGTATCAGAPCTAIVRTTDGGRTWASIPAPDAALLPGGSGTSGVSGLRFADALDGWAFGPDLWATHDGGATWHRVSLPGLSADGQVMTLETAAGAVHAVYFDGNAAGLLAIATSPVGTDAWAVAPTTVELGAGPVPHPQLVLLGTAGWLVEVDRAVVAGARLVAGEWKPWQPPCLDVAGPATLAAASASDLVVACDEGVWSTPTGVHLYLSSDGGATFTPAASKVPVFSIEGVAAPAPGVAFVAGSLSGVGSAIVGSFDGGATWTAVHVLQGAGSLDLSFTTAEEGVAISTSGDGTSELLMTRDGGRTWSKVPIAGG
jgi:photosystem II stability/assembly factor-like uncharacterized protein